MKMMPPDVISHENQSQHLSEPSIFMLDVFRTADHAGQIFIPHRMLAGFEDVPVLLRCLANSKITPKMPFPRHMGVTFCLLLFTCLRIPDVLGYVFIISLSIL